MKAVIEKLIIDKTLFLKIILKIFGIFTFTSLMIIAGRISIPLPFTPVPLTLQTLFVLLSGAFLGAKEGAISQINYLLLGLVGLPVFAGGASGATRLLGPTGGYLIGFIFSSYFLGWFLNTKNCSWLKVITGMVIAIFIIHGLGVLRLAWLLQLNLFDAFLKGSFPFLPGEIAKIILASSIYKVIKYLKN